MILGETCTRPCGFCSVKRGKPEEVADDEPERLAEACARLGLKHVVITSVTRDDLADGGADHFRRCILAVRERTGATIEVLTPDFDGSTDAVDIVMDAPAGGLQPQPGDRQPAPAVRPPQEPVRRQPQGPGARQADVPAGPDQDRPDARPRRDDRGDPRNPGRPPGDRLRLPDPRPVPPADPAAPAGRPLPPARGVRRTRPDGPRPGLRRGRQRPLRAVELPRRRDGRARKGVRGFRQPLI